MSFGSFMKDMAKATVRGAASGGGMLSTPFRAAQVGTGTVGGINKGLKQYRKKQVQTPKPPQPAKPAKMYRKKQQPQPYITQPPKVN